MNFRSIRLCLLLALIANISFGQDATPTDLLKAILVELKALRVQLTQTPQQAVAGRHVQIATGNAPFLGDKNAPLTIVNFTDFECPYCNRFYSQTFSDLKRLFIDTGKVRFYSMDFPLSGIHPSAMGAALAGRCANEQNQFWPMHDYMQGHPKELTTKELSDFAGALKMDLPRFRECVESRKYSAEIEKDINLASTLGVEGTPAFVVGKSTPDGVDGEIVLGAVPLGIFQKTLEH